MSTASSGPILDDPRKLRIAICGGGLGGVALANALLHHSHLDVHIYESKPEFSVRGAAIGVATNAQKALAAFVPSVSELLSRAGAVQMNSMRLLVGSGPNAGTTVFDIPGSEQGVNVHRAALLRELLAPIPADRLHSRKQLLSVVSGDNDDDGSSTSAPGPLQLRFEDSTVDYADALIGADGIFGLVRQHVLQGEEQASPGGWRDTRRLVTVEEAREKLGEELLRTPRQYGWIGDQGFIFHDALDDGKMLQCIASGVERDVIAGRKKPLDREVLEATFKPWLDGPIAGNMIDLLLNGPAPASYSQYQHKTTARYFRHRVCLLGDAAHAMVPWQGSGASQAFEDATILAAVMAQATTPAAIEAAFTAYDAVRRPRAQAIVESSHHSGRIMSGLDPEVGLDPERLREALRKNWEFIYAFDLERDCKEAMDTMRALLQ